MRITARLRAGGRWSRSQLKLKLAAGRRGGARASSNLYWTPATGGHLMCNRPTELEPGLRMFHPAVSSNGEPGQFYNHTEYVNRLYQRAGLYYYKRGWWISDWQVIAFPPYTVYAIVGPGQDLGAPPEGQGNYIAGIAYVRWEYGLKDWNWVSADTPYFGYGVLFNTWCEVP